MKQLNSVLAEQQLAELGGVPIDRLAWRVIQPGEHYERPDKVRMLCFDAPPPTVDLRRNHNHYNDQATKDLTGIRSGRLTVWGYWGRRKGFAGSNNQLWVCRCLCGLFTIRRASKILRKQLPNEDPQMCAACASLELEKKGIPRQVALEFVKDTDRKLELHVVKAIFDVLHSGDSWSSAIRERTKQKETGEYIIRERKL